MAILTLQQTSRAGIDPALVAAAAGGDAFPNAGRVFLSAKNAQPLTRQEANLFFRMVSYRYGRGAMLITTNKAVKDWPEILAGDEAMATALLDRLLHRCHVLSVKGRSYRLRDLERRLA